MTLVIEVYVPQKIPFFFKSREIKSTHICRIPAICKYYVCPTFYANTVKPKPLQEFIAVTCPHHTANP